MKMMNSREIVRKVRLEIEHRFIRHLLETSAMSVDVNIPVFTPEEFEILWQQKKKDFGIMTYTPEELHNTICDVLDKKLAPIEKMINEKLFEFHVQITEIEEILTVLRNNNNDIEEELKQLRKTTPTNKTG